MADYGTRKNFGSEICGSCFLVMDDEAEMPNQLECCLDKDLVLGK